MFSNGTHRHHLALLWHIRGTVAETETRLQRIECRFKQGLLLQLWRFLLGPVTTECLQLGLHALHRILVRTILQPRHLLPYPLQQLHTRISHTYIYVFNLHIPT